MKRGIAFTPSWPGMREIPEDYEVEGVPVTRTPLARARGFWPFKWIEVGERFFSLDAREQMAVLLHEVGHCRLWHMEIRFFLMPFFWTKWARRISVRQEFAADDFVRRMSYASDMVRYLRRSAAEPARGWHPAVILRIDNLER